MPDIRILTLRVRSAMRRNLSLLVLLTLAVLGAFADAARAATQITTRVSVDSAGNQANDLSGESVISSDGRYVAFGSGASNLVPNDTNNLCDYNGDYVFNENCADVFVHDRLTGTTERVSVDSTGNQANKGSGSPDISADGRFVVFISSATNLVPPDTNGFLDAFVHDRLKGNTERVSVDGAGNEANDDVYGPVAISSDGRFVVFRTRASNLVSADTNGWDDVFVRDRLTGVTDRVSVDSAGNQADLPSDHFAISGDGRFVAFDSLATNLVYGDTNNFPDIFVRDRLTGTTERASVDSLGNEAEFDSHEPAISADGRFVAFESRATNLVDGDTNNHPDIFVHDRLTGTTELASVDSAGGQANDNSCCSSLSADGRFVAFGSSASNLTDDVDTNGTKDAFVHDRKTGITAKVSVSSEGTPGNNVSAGFPGPSISADGRFVAFASVASNLVLDDTNGHWDVFLHDLGNTDSDGEWDPFDPCPANPDCDNDGFTDGVELRLGTNPVFACPTTTTPNDEAPDPWPPDADDDRDVDIGDVLALFYGKLGNPPNYTPRSDFDADGDVDVGDVIAGFKDTIGTNCA